MTFLSLAAQTQLLPGVLTVHRQRNLDYLMELKTENLVRPYLFEAGLYRCNQRLEGIHEGWDGPLSDLRGQFTGHWLSAAARLIQCTGDEALRLKAREIVSQVALCQKENGGQWGFPIPEKRLLWLKNGKHTWAPQYVCHKVMMGLLDMYRYIQDQQALEVVLRDADWFVDFTKDISRERMSDMMDWEETGGMMELWADLYAITQDEKHLTLMRSYERPRLFEPLLQGVDVLTNMHANTTIPEIHGAARAYEVTGEERYRRIVEAYWRMAVDLRGFYATGGQTCGELWTPMGRQAARLGDFNQEHCAVYHMMRLAEYLQRWTGEIRYGDYWERNMWNGILSQGYWEDDFNRDIFCDSTHRDSGLVAYYQGLGAGSRKHWGSRTHHFWCCHGTLVQANASLHEGIFYRTCDGLAICQYQPAEVCYTAEGNDISLRMDLDSFTGENIRIQPIQREMPTRPAQVRLLLQLRCTQPATFTLRIRIPWWIQGEPVVMDHHGIVPTCQEDGYLLLRRCWHDDQLSVAFPKSISCHALPDAPDTVAFLDGPVVLAGLCQEERTPYGDCENPVSLLVPRYERRWQEWTGYWKTTDQPVNINFIPLYQIGNQPYTVYFPIQPKSKV